jgi:hypothetical protein
MLLTYELIHPEARSARERLPLEVLKHGGSLFGVELWSGYRMSHLHPSKVSFFPSAAR